MNRISAGIHLDVDDVSDRCPQRDVAILVSAALVPIHRQGS
jgi:hypothetical protein